MLKYKSVSAFANNRIMVGLRTFLPILVPIIFVLYFFHVYCLATLKTLDTEKRVCRTNQVKVRFIKQAIHADFGQIPEAA